MFNYKSLSLNSKNSTVTDFEYMVDSRLNSTNESSTTNVTESATSSQEEFKNIETEFSKELYDKAVSLPESNSAQLSYSYLNDEAKTQYCKFTGGNVYSTFDGDISESNKNVKELFGWAIFDNSSEDYCLLVNNKDNSSQIVATKDIKPQPIVDDFSTVYDKLKQQNYSKVESYIDDTKSTHSLSATFKEDVSKFINEANTSAAVSYKENNGETLIGETVYNRNKIELSEYTSPDDFSKIVSGSTNEAHDALNVPVVKPSLSDTRESVLLNWQDAETGTSASESVAKYKHGTNVLTNQINAKDKPVNINFNNINKATEWNWKDFKPVVIIVTVDTNAEKEILECYQLPENVSYSIASQYDAVVARGTQAPIQVYNQTNQVELSFTLKWHIDEVRDPFKFDENGKKISTSGSDKLMEYANIAESLARPYGIGVPGAINSVRPKECHIMMPSIDRHAYISNASITFSGDLSSDSPYSSEDDKLVEVSNKDKKFVYSSTRHYSVLEITFTAIVLNEVELKPIKQSTTQKADDTENNMSLASGEEVHTTSSGQINMSVADPASSQSSSSSNEPMYSSSTNPT